MLNGRRGFHFEIDAELIVFGKTEPDARVTLQGEPVKLRPDGTFTVRYAMPNARQVIPAVAHSADGSNSARSCWPSNATRRRWNRWSATAATAE